MGADENRGDRSRGPVLIVGLGNPGIEYQFTPHNAGFLAIDRIAEQCGAMVANRRSKALTATARLAGREVILAKPQTYMNLSGESIVALLRDVYGEAEEAALQNLLVLYDELALPLGSIRVRERGSSGGHNGARSVSGALGTQEWLRVRIGVGPEAGRQRGRDYLLSPMSKRDLQVLDVVLDDAAKAVDLILAEGVTAAMNRYNRREPDQGPDASAKDI